MFFGPVIIQYFTWHYTTALSEYVRLTRTGIDFWWHFFSIPILTVTLFSPFKRVVEKPAQRFNFEEVFGSIVINLLSRLIGACIRIFLIISGLVVTLLFIGISLISFGVWLAAPLLIPFCIMYGGALIIISL